MLPTDDAGVRGDPAHDSRRAARGRARAGRTAVATRAAASCCRPRSPGLVTAVILGVARAIGETAPMLLTAFGADTTNTNPLHGSAVRPSAVRVEADPPARTQTQIDRAWTGALILVMFVLVLFVERPPRREPEPTQAREEPDDRDRSHRPTIATARAPVLHERRANPATLDATNVSAWFGKRKVLERCSLHMDARRVTALIGPSGCGKSTFLRILNRMHEVIPGAQIAGQRRARRRRHLRRRARARPQVRTRIGMVFQKPNPFPAMSIGENVLAGLEALADAHARIATTLVEECLTPGRAVERGEGPARRRRHVAVGWSAAAPVHRPRARGAPAGAADGRAVLRARPDLDARRRGDDRASSRPRSRS